MQRDNENLSQRAAEILTVSGLSKSFGGVHAVKDCSFGVRRNSITGLIGPNGSGKTTTFNLISGVERPDSGEIVLGGDSLNSVPPFERSRRGLGRTFQVNRSLQEMSVIENMLVAGEGGGLGATAAARRAVRLLRMVGLDGHVKADASELSYGQQKLLEISRVHMNPEYRLVLLDEPFAGVNRALAATLLDYLKVMKRDEGMTYLLVDHEMKLVMNLCTHLLVMNAGSILMSGEPQEVRNSPEVLEAYFGKA